LNPNTRFIQNSTLQAITSKKKYIHIDDHKIQNIAKSILKKMKKTNIYSEYMHQESNDAEIGKILILKILKHQIIINEKIHDFIEEHSIYWNDDLLIVYNTLLEKINNDQNLNILELFRHKEDKTFAYRLLEKSVEKADEINQIIFELAKNWDKDRIAISDLIIMRMAITEMRYFTNIPHKVTLDEYIDISKEYSSPKSKEFINGILDKYTKDILEKKL
ncbi:MAG: transcription antitermination factor NusB, partial [Flavobacteriales bacterium]|nr:transcription antitermination factor NusB [Flavobacteriales bacterium]